MPGKHQYDDLQKNRQLSGDGSLVGKAAEGSADEQRKNGDDDPCNQRKNDLLKFIQKSCDQLRFCPGGGKAQHHCKHKSTHNGHDLRDLQFKDHLRQLLQSCSIGMDGQMWNDQKAGGRRKKRCANRGAVSEDNRNSQHQRSIFAKPGNGRSDKSQHDQRYAEGNDLAQNVLDSNCDIENCHGDSVGAVPVQDKPGHDPQDHSNQQLKWQTVEKRCFFHWKNLLG